MNRTVNILATGEVQQETLGGYKYLAIRQASNAFQISFDGHSWRTASQNKSYGPLKDATYVFFKASNGLAATVTFEYGNDKVEAQDTAQSQASTFPVANLGIATGAAAVGILPACDANGYLQITNNMMLLVSGNNAGRPRQQIIFSVSSGSLNVLTPDSTAGVQYVFMTIPAGQVISLDSDTDWILSGVGGTCKASVGQIFLNRGA